MQIADTLEPATFSQNDPGGDYNLLPYRSVPYHQSEPAHMAAMARLFSLEAPLPATASVLELGCAAGGNIIPLAALFPQARFVGIDLTERQVADGNARIRRLGLTNIEIRQGDIATIDLAGERFDYMICHGVYSWIPPEAQEAVFAIAARTLAENGVAYVSYNTYPGWHMRTIVRDICLYHAGQEGAPAYRVARARWVLEKLASLTSETTPFGQMLRKEAQLNARLPDSYILGEFLATHNAPCFFHEFLARAARHGLRFLCEADFASSVPETLGTETAALVRSIAGKNGLALEQYMDFFVGRQFRRSLLVREATGAPLSRKVNADHLVGLHLSSTLRRDAEASKDGAEVFRSAKGTVTVNDPVTPLILGCLESAFPDTRTAEEIVDHVVSNAGRDRPELRHAVMVMLFRMVAGAQAEVSALPLRTGRALDARPELWRVARDEARLGQGWVSSLRHGPVGLDAGIASVATAFDGTRDHAALRDAVLDAILAGTIKIKGLEMTGHTSRDQLAPVAQRALARILGYFERNALLARAPAAALPPPA